jgi:hypothetical protein
MSEQFPFSQQPDHEMGDNEQYAGFSEDEETVFTQSEPSPYTPDMTDDDDEDIPATREDGIPVQYQTQAELPPEARGELNGGPLGCCMGITIGILVCFAIGLVGLGQITANVLVTLIHADPLTEIRVATGFFAAIGAVLGGVIGWKVGKRIYREYEMSPRQQARLVRLNDKALQRTQLKH